MVRVKRKEEILKGNILNKDSVRLGSRHRLPVRIITHNIRYAATSLLPGECNWQIRRSRIVAELLFHTRCCDTVIALQEVLYHQLKDILEGLNQSIEGDNAQNTARWDYVGVGRDDGRTGGEFVPIIFQPAVWSLEASRTLWLSLTPDRPSKDWGSGSRRVLTAAWFKHQVYERKMLVLNTHLDNASEEARYESASLIVRWIKEWTSTRSGHETLPVILAGDFNSEVDGEAYRLLTSEMSVMTDTEEIAPINRRYGHLSTYTGFNGDEAQRIDFILIGPRFGNCWKPEGYAVLENRFEDGIFCSDHRAVVADMAMT